MQSARRAVLTAVIAVVSLGVFASFAAARPGAQIPQPSLSCLQNAMTTADMNTCIGAAYAKAQKQLAAAYAKVLASAQGDKAVLKAAQAKWIAYRDADCAYSASLNAGGTLAGVDKGICLVRDTIDRANALRDELGTS